MTDLTIREAPLTDDVAETLIALSRDWANENSCHGYRANNREDIEGMRVFLAEAGGRVVGYLFGKPFRAEKSSSIMPDGTACFEVEELYVILEARSKGVGRALMAAAEDAVRGEAEFLMLSTATKNWRAILHFYIDEVGMAFWSARLFKKL
ncbi:MAG: GNAT family N-acetyltransferase [Clostridia bacterium]|nr:GNAT family N-acetyltransferase [Clostridia bacterium]